MDRRDFLLLRTTPTARVAELRGQALYMRSLDARLTHRADDEGFEHLVDGSADWLRETVEDLKRQLADVALLRVFDGEWIADGPLGRGVDEVISAFVRRGGRVEKV